MKEMVVICPDEATTIKVGEKVADLVKDGGVIELVGDVGSGKTTFVKGIAKGTGCKDKISSPSFALKNVYEGRLTIYHFDFYRLEKPGPVKQELEEAIEEDGSLTIVEWGKSVKDMMTKSRIIVTFSVTDENSRELTISLPENLK